MEIPSPETGIIKEISVSVGDKVSEGSLIARIETKIEKPSKIDESVAEKMTGKPKDVKEINKITEESKKVKESEIKAKKGKEEITVSKAASKTTTDETLPKTAIQELKVPDIGTQDAVEIIEMSITKGQKISKDDPLIFVWHGAERYTGRIARRAAIIMGPCRSTNTDATTATRSRSCRR